MDKKKKMMAFKRLLIVWITAMALLPLHAQGVKQVQICGRSLNDTTGEISLFLKLLDGHGKAVTTLDENSIKDCLNVFEESRGVDLEKARIKQLFSGKRISADYTFSVLIDLSIPQDGKDKIYETLKKLVESAPDGSVYISFFGDDVTSTEMVSESNYRSIKEKFDKSARQKWFYDAVFCKLAEFNNDIDGLSGRARLAEGYQTNHSIANRANKHPDKNILIILSLIHI